MSGSLLKMKGLPQGAVDMGLPSGTLWAQGNIVKDAQGNYSIGQPTDKGCYFTWGNIVGYNTTEIGSASGKYMFNTKNYEQTPGYLIPAGTSIASNDSEHDAAVALIGNGFYMPTNTQIQELLSSANTVITDDTVDGVSGKRITSVRNPNASIFLPFSGHYFNMRLYDGDRVQVWSSANIDSYYAYILGLPVVYGNTTLLRCIGAAIRPVHNAI